MSRASGVSSVEGNVAAGMVPECPLCSGRGEAVAQQRLLGRYDVRYFRCPTCDLMFTEKPYWLEEAYTETISRLDTGAINRNLLSAQLTLLISVVAGSPRGASALDFGGGHGVFVRMMRDLGLDFRWYDKHARNEYAVGFEGTPGEPHQLVTAFEVLEHLADVRADLDLLFSARPALVLVGTLLHDGHRQGWWYYLLESGQHVSFFSRHTMEYVARAYGYRAFVGRDHTLFVRHDHALGVARSRLLDAIVRNASASMVLTSLIPRGLAMRLAGYRSRVESDHALLGGGS